jgi:putative glutamine amidotransferase
VTRPAVGITIGDDPKRDGFHLLRADYVRSVEEAGGLPVLLVPGKPQDASELLSRLDALLMTGGADVDPSLYGQEPHPKLGRVFPERDRFEIALCREALENDFPLLAICRGHQVLNVATGGTLVQDLPSEIGRVVEHDPEVERDVMAHLVSVVPGTRLHEILGRSDVAVNSFHHQSVDRPGHGLVVSARSTEDSVIEGIEAPGHRFAIGVQWHPESFWGGKPGGFAPLFDGLIAAARMRSGAMR